MKYSFGYIPITQQYNLIRFGTEKGDINVNEWDEKVKAQLKKKGPFLIRQIIAKDEETGENTGAVVYIGDYFMPNIHYKTKKVINPPNIIQVLNNVIKCVNNYNNFSYSFFKSFKHGGIINQCEINCYLQHFLKNDI